MYYVFGLLWLQGCMMWLIHMCIIASGLCLFFRCVQHLTISAAIYDTAVSFRFFFTQSGFCHCSSQNIVKMLLPCCANSFLPVYCMW